MRAPHGNAAPWLRNRRFGLTSGGSEAQMQKISEELGARHSVRLSRFPLIRVPANPAEIAPPGSDALTIIVWRVGREVLRQKLRAISDDVGDCWICSYPARRSGRLGIKLPGGRWVRAARLSYEAYIGPVPAGLDVTQSCGVRLCVNPGHLEAISRAELVMRGQGACAKFARRTHCGRGHPFSGDNLSIEGKRRRCITCRRARVARIRGVAGAS